MDEDKGWPLIYAAMGAAMQEIEAIGKTRRNAQQGYNFRGIDDFMNQLHPVLAKNNLILAPEVLEHTREERKTAKGTSLIYSVIKVRYTIYAQDGSSVSATVIGEGMDSGDKASNKAMSAAYKYAVMQLFSIPTDELKDPDAETPPPVVPQDYVCEECGQIIQGVVCKNGETISPEEIARRSMNKFGRQLCYQCSSKQG